MKMQKIDSKTIVFIHGLFLNGKSWDKWISFFEVLGYKCYAPSYPFHEGEPEYLRKNINSKLGYVSFSSVVEHLSLFIDKLPEKPILIGHSIGGLLVQKLIELDKGVLGVSISPAPPKGIFSFKWSFFKANFPTINPFKGNSVCLPSVKWFQYAFCNTMTLEKTQIEYDKFVVPESRNIPRSTIGKEGEINFKKLHNPLLIISGEKDNIIPFSINIKNFQAYKDTNSILDFKKFSGRTHYICGQDNWEEVATFINEWILKLK